MNSKRLEAELKHLFGADIAEESKRLSMVEIFADIELIPELITRLSMFDGEPRQQRKYIEGLKKSRAKSLCYWLREV